VGGGGIYSFYAGVIWDLCTGFSTVDLIGENFRLNINDILLFTLGFFDKNKNAREV